jgi:hypothetical protein
LAYLKIKIPYKKFAKFKTAKKLSLNDEVYSLSFSENVIEKKSGFIKKLEEKRVYSSIIFEN